MLLAIIIYCKNISFVVFFIERQLGTDATGKSVAEKVKIIFT